MSPSIIDAQSILAVEIGTVTTRALLFDVVEGQYRFIAQGSAPSTVNAPFREAGEGIHLAVNRLEEITGRTLMNLKGELILPVQSDNSGVDRLVLTYTAGPALRVVVAGLLADVSLESARNLAATLPVQVVETLGLNDTRSLDLQMQALIAAEPDLVLLAGGSEHGASRSVFKLAELISLAYRVLPPDRRPHVLYAGNQALAKKIKEGLERTVHTLTAPNVRPSVDVEDLAPAESALSEAAANIRYAQIGGLQNWGSISSALPLPGSLAFGRMIRFLSHIGDAVKGVLGVQLGSGSTTLAMGKGGNLALEVFPYSSGRGASLVLEHSALEDITQWLPMHMPDVVARDYLVQKTLYPQVMPTTSETLALELALARQALRLSMQQMLARHPLYNLSYEPILAGGAVLTQAPQPAHALLALLDGLQPVGVTTLFLDQNELLTSLGAAAQINSLLPVQVIESGALLNLGTVICPVSDARYGTPILRARLEYERGGENVVEVRQGSLVTLPLQNGQVANLHLQPLRRVQIDPRGKPGPAKFQIVGGACGAVIDARGRPLVLPKDSARRREMIKKWSLAFGI